MSDSATAGARLRLDYVSPLPPVRSGISDYSADLLPHLEPLCDLRVIALAGQEVAEEIAERWRPVPEEACGEDGRLPLYQMGNNPYHDEVLDLALETPGVVTLHDLFLHHLLMERTLAKRRFSPYKKQLEHDHGWMGAAVAMPPRWGGWGCRNVHAALQQDPRAEPTRHARSQSVGGRSAARLCR